MYTALQIAQYFLQIAANEGEELLSNMKLQKLLYYAQGFNLAISGKVLFNDPIRAWIYGPVVPSVYYEFQKYEANGIPPKNDTDISNLSDETKELLDEVYNVYGQFSAWRLKDLTHEEPPRKNADNNEIISLDLMKEYFSTQLK